MPSLPPALNPWMMRPRAGQRNSGSVPAASACAPVSGGLVCAAPDSRLPVGVLSIAGFLASTPWTAQPWRPPRPCASFEADFSASLDLSALATAFSFSLSFACLATGRPRRRRLPRAFSPPSPSGARDGAAVGVIDGHDDVHAAPDLGGAGKAVGGEKRGGGHAVAARERVEGLAVGDDDRRAAGGGPARGRAADRLGPRERSAARRRGRGGRALRQRRRRHAATSARRRGALLANGLENGLSLWEKRVTSDEHPASRRSAQSSQRETRERASSLSTQRNHSSASTHAHATADERTLRRSS